LVASWAWFGNTASFVSAVATVDTVVEGVAGAVALAPRVAAVTGAIVAFNGITSLEEFRLVLSVGAVFFCFG
jgi:hypothetical protein